MDALGNGPGSVAAAGGWQDLSLIRYLDSAVQDMIGEVSSSEARAAWHGRFSTESIAIPSGKRLPIPFLSAVFLLMRRGELAYRHPILNR